MLYKLSYIVLAIIICSIRTSMITKVFQTKWQGEGVGAKVRRAIGIPELPDLDPFLMLDFFKVRLPAGFPDHPHRGFETVTYMVQGKFFHEDFKGNKGTIGPGDIQWMTAGKGIVHAEMPASKDEDSIGFQLWVNLPHEKKLTPAKYQEFRKEEIPVYQDDQKKVIVISGDYKEVQGKIKPESTAHFYDVHLQPGAEFNHVIPNGWNALVYPYTDAPFKVNDREIDPFNACAMKGNGQPFVVKNNGADSLAKFAIFYGKPLNEPIERYGPFVLSTKESLQQAFNDYQNQENGFEHSQTWESGIKDLADL